MDQLLQQQHAQDGTSNFSEQELKDTLGGILSFLKSKFGSVEFDKIQAALPETADLVADAESKNASRDAAGGGGGGGASSLMSSAMGMLGGGGGQQGGSSGGAPADGSAASPIESMTQLLGYLGKMGVKPKEAMAFLPIVTKFLNENANVDASSALGTSSTGGGEATSQTTGDAGSSGNDMVGNLMNQASGFMSSFGKK